MTVDILYSVAIPTMNRPAELKRCLKRVLAQKPMPVEIIIIDDGNLGENQIQDAMGREFSRIRLIRKEKPGLVGSLNLAAKECRTPWLLVLDDDIILAKNYVEHIINYLMNDHAHQTLGAIVGIPLQKLPKPNIRTKCRLLLERLFLITGRIEGRFLPSSFCTDFGRGWRPRHPYSIEHIPSGLAWWQTKVLKQNQYDTWFEGYAYGTDKELALRVSRQYRVICHPSARALHNKSPNSRLPSERLGFMKVRNHTYIFQRHFGHRYISRILFYWAMIGQLLLSFTALIGSNNISAQWLEVKGMTHAMIEYLILNGKPK